MFTSSQEHGIYTLKLKSTGTGGLRRMEFGDKVVDKPNKTLLFRGATGSGKTTLINWLINYIMGVEYKYEFRLKLIDEDTSKSQAHSQTSEVTAYQINHQEFFRLPYSLSLVDTPGFGDTGGKEVDEQITEKIIKFFSTKGGIDSIDAVCLVVQSSLVRLTESQKYIFGVVLDLFGKEINPILMTTFADDEDPQVLHAIKAANFPCAKNSHGDPFYFKFNNSSFSTVPDNEMGMVTPPPSWVMGEVGMKRFFDRLYMMSPKSLTSVLQERRVLQEKLKKSEELLSEGLLKLDEITKTEEAVKQCEKTADSSKDFTYVITEYEKVVNNLGYNMTYCPQCEYPCHRHCGSADNKKECCVMSYWFWRAGIYCNSCPKNCHWKYHVNRDWEIENKLVTKTMTKDDLKKKFDTAMEMKLDTEKALEKLKSEYEDTKGQLLKCIEDMVKCLARLQEIALHPVQQSMSSFIKKKIQAEQKEAKPGYENRVQHLQALLGQAQLSEEGI